MTKDLFTPTPGQKAAITRERNEAALTPGQKSWLTKQRKAAARRAANTRRGQR